MNKIAIFFSSIVLITGCAVPNVYIAPSSTIRVGDTIQIPSMHQDPLGGVAKIIIALEKRGFTTLSGEIGATVTNNTTKGSETYRKTRASHYLTFTYTTANGGHASCRLVSVASGRAEVIVDMQRLPINAADICADEVLKAASGK